MATALKINGGWLYLAPKERRCINEIIKLLVNAKTKDNRLHTSYFQEKLGVSDKTTSHALFLLMGAHIIKPQQYGRLRLWSLVSGWKARLNEKTYKTSNENES